MTTTAINRASLEKQIWKACDELRSVLPIDQVLESVLDVLLWARWIPASDGALVGYFDAMRSLANADEWHSIQKAIAERSGMSFSPAAATSHLEYESLERLRSTLLPVGRALNSGDSLQCRSVIEAITELKLSNRSGGELGCSASMGGFWKALLTFADSQSKCNRQPIGHTP